MDEKQNVAVVCKRISLKDWNWIAEELSQIKRVELGNVDG